MKSLPDQVLLQPSVAFLQCPPPVDQINELSGLVFVVGCSQPPFFWSLVGEPDYSKVFLDILITQLEQYLAKAKATCLQNPLLSPGTFHV